MFLETIKIVEGRVYNLRYHQSRLNKTVIDHYGVDHPGYFLTELIHVPEKYRKGTVKCRVVYGQSQMDISYARYKIKDIKSLKIVASEDIDYHYKYLDRSKILHLVDQKALCDDILIIQNGLLTDTSYANIALVKDGLYFTPKEPLLKGTARMRLLSHGKLIEKNLERNLSAYDYVTIFNAMVSIDQIKISVANIY